MTSVNMSRLSVLLMMFTAAVVGCAVEEKRLVTAGTETVRAPAPVCLHHLGHAAFALEFDSGVKILIDYGKSRSYGLDSPICGLGELKPDVAVYSHEHEDHAGGTLPNGANSTLSGGRDLSLNGVDIISIPTYERSLDEPDNTSYLFCYKGMKILHLGDCQALIVNAGNPVVRERIQTLYPDFYDIVLLPIGFVSDIVEPAANFMNFIRTRGVIPMHYWKTEDRDRFLDAVGMMKTSSGRPIELTVIEGSAFCLERVGGETDVVRVFSLTPAPYSR